MATAKASASARKDDVVEVVDTRPAFFRRGRWRGIPVELPLDLAEPREEAELLAVFVCCVSMSIGVRRVWGALRLLGFWERTTDGNTAQHLF